MVHFFTFLVRQAGHTHAGWHRAAAARVGLVLIVECQLPAVREAGIPVGQIHLLPRIRRRADRGIGGWPVWRRARRRAREKPALRLETRESRPRSHGLGSQSHLLFNICIAVDIASPVCDIRTYSYMHMCIYNMYMCACTCTCMCEARGRGGGLLGGGRGGAGGARGCPLTSARVGHARRALLPRRRSPE